MIEDPAKWISATLGLLSAGAGFVSVRYWYLSSVVKTLPLWARTPNAIEPLDPNTANAHWIVGVLESANKVSRLNRVAAAWTGAAVALSALSTVAGIFT